MPNPSTIEAQEEMERLALEVVKGIILEQRPLPADFRKVLNENFWELLSD